MSQLSRKHRKNRGERYERRRAAAMARHRENQGRVISSASPLFAVRALLLELKAVESTIADYYASHA